jgi:hypothetical protein
MVVGMKIVVVGIVVVDGDGMVDGVGGGRGC